ncbi:MAG: hypothetical protein Fur006_49310 [Coleofasciculaceae cyanobacterium]
MFRKPLNEKLESFQSSLLQFELSDREQERICGGKDSRPYKGPMAVQACVGPNDMLPPGPGLPRC